jgi:hypothetical protein
VHHHHHHHDILYPVEQPSSAHYRGLIASLFAVLMTACLVFVTLIAWNFYNLAECEKKRLPWDAPCKSQFNF